MSRRGVLIRRARVFHAVFRMWCCCCSCGCAEFLIACRCIMWGLLAQEKCRARLMCVPWHLHQQAHGGDCCIGCIHCLHNNKVLTQHVCLFSLWWLECIIVIACMRLLW